MKKIIDWVLRLLAAIIMVQTLYFKFSAAPESVDIFTKVGIEPWGRIGTGIAELIASILLLIRSTVVFGAAMGVGIMLGAVAAHLFIIGIVSHNDGGLLFAYAMTVLVSCAILVVTRKHELFKLLGKQK